MIFSYIYYYVRRGPVWIGRENRSKDNSWKGVQGSSVKSVWCGVPGSFGAAIGGEGGIGRTFDYQGYCAWEEGGA